MPGSSHDLACPARLLLLACALLWSAPSNPAIAQPEQDLTSRTPFELEIEDEPAEPDNTPPQIVSISPAPSKRIVNQFGLSEIRLRFSEEIVAPPGSVRGWTLGGLRYDALPTIFDPVKNELLVLIPSAVRDDAFTLVVDYSLTDQAGNALDGENNDALSPIFPTGDGKPGGRSVYRFEVLQGDVNRDGVVDQDDGDAILAALGSEFLDVNYNLEADLNSDTRVNVLDVSLWLANLGASIPLDDGTRPTALTISPGLSVTGDIEGIRIEFSENINVSRLDPRSLFVIDSRDRIIPASSVSIDADGVTIFAFSPSLDGCQNYQVNLTGSIADESGALLDIPAIAPRLEGLVRPGAVTLDNHDSVTNSGFVTFTGAVKDAAAVRIVTPEESVTAQVINGLFSAQIALRPDSVNTVFFTGVSPCGVTGVSISTSVVMDRTAPSLFIDFPQPGSRVYNSTTDVAGRVGDMLSGFMGLTVLVNGVEADVDAGIGTNGTFFARDVPLAPIGEPTVIEATAIDELGNSRTISLMLEQAAVPVGRSRFEVLGNSSREGQVRTTLNEPIAVRVSRPDGSPVAGKVVTFEVTRSDGALSADAAAAAGSPMLQALTDDDGVARAYWSLGSDAGCGNNRVTVTSRDIVADVTFCATARVSAPTQMNISAGSGQRVQAGADALQPLRIWLSDGRNGVEGVAVAFFVIQGGGLLGGSTTAITTTSRTGHAQAIYQAPLEPGVAIVRAIAQGSPGVYADFIIEKLQPAATNETGFTGAVVTNSLEPIRGATIRLVDAGGRVLTTQTSSDGFFRFDDIETPGPANLLVDGTTADKAGAASLSPGSFPSLDFPGILILDGVENSLGTPISLPFIQSDTGVVFDGTKSVTLTIPEIDGLKMEVPMTTVVTKPDGTIASPTNPIVLSLSQVKFDAVPMPMPDGAAPPFAWTLQPTGATFDPPLRVEYPNISGLAPGTITNFLQFVHETGEFEIVASGRVSPQGDRIFSDPGVGIPIAGWGCNCPPYSITSDCCVEGRSCQDSGALDTSNVSVVALSGSEARIQDVLVWQISGVEDTGGKHVVRCPGGAEGEREEDIPAGAPVVYKWIITDPDGQTREGEGARAEAIAGQCGTWTVRFWAEPNPGRACPPPPTSEFTSTIEVAVAPWTFNPQSPTVKFPADLVNRFLRFARLIPGVSARVFSEGIEATLKSGIRDCCSDDGTLASEDGQQFAEGEFKLKAEIEGPIGPGINIKETVVVAGSAITIELKVGVFLSLNMETIAIAGLGTNPCNDNSEPVSCPYGSFEFKVEFGPVPEILARACYDAFNIAQVCAIPFQFEFKIISLLQAKGELNSRTSCSGLEFSGSIDDIVLDLKIIALSVEVFKGSFNISEAVSDQ